MAYVNTTPADIGLLNRYLTVHAITPLNTLPDTPFFVSACFGTGGADSGVDERRSVQA